MKVLVVSRTRMGGGRRCIGAIAEDGRALRLLSSTGANPDATSPFLIGEIWELEWTRRTGLTPPHVEDVLVTKREHVGEQADLARHLAKRVHPWRGGVEALYGGVVRFTGKNNGYISEVAGVPAQSTGFWVPDRDLSFRGDDKHYDYPGRPRPRGLSYVGEVAPIPVIPAGTLVRVSLARWWAPEGADSNTDQRCYLQLSGWY